MLNVVGELSASARKKLNAVVFKGVVGGTDHDTSARSKGARKIGYSGRGHRA